MNYDYIVIGAGSAGCAVAARLSEDGDCSVLLLEAGGPDKKQEVTVPVAFSKLFKTDVDWNYETEPQPNMGDRTFYWPRGKMLGGSSSINAMIYQRGAAANYDGWAALGNEGWSYADVLPLFKRMENQAHGANEYHGVGGPLNVMDQRDPNQLSQAFVDAAVSLGYARNDDFNDGSQEGFGLYQVTQKRGKRFSAVNAYLKPALKRPNLTVTTHAQATNLIFDGKRCTGVAYVHDGASAEATANQEVILCGGAINSPQLLLLSGIGDAAHLGEMGIDVVMELPGVGQNLQDHLIGFLTYHCTQDVSLAKAESIPNVLNYLLRGRGMLTSNVGEAGGFVTVLSDSVAPDLQFHFAPAFFIDHGFASPTTHGFSLGPTLVRSESVGHLKLRSSDPLKYPVIQPNYVSDARDMEILVEGIKIAHKIAEASAFDPYRGDPYLPDPIPESDEEIRTHLRATVQTLYHPVGTCKMGNDSMAVVDDQLRVHGIDGLRVADASIMPEIINANTNVPAIMIGEKAAELVRG